MRLVLSAGGPNRDDALRFAAQLGVDGVMSGPGREDTPNGYYEYPWLVSLKSHAESYGLTVEAMSLIAWRLCYKWMLGLPGRDEQIGNFLTSIRNMGAAGVPVLVFNMHALRYYRTSTATPDRGGALSTSFEFERVKDAPLMTVGSSADTGVIPADQRRPISDEEMWANYTYLIKAAVPVAEEAGVKLALHPDDPQVPVIAGVARIMRSPDAFRRAMEIMPSENLGLKYCTGCFGQMGADQVKEIHYFGGRKKIFLVDFRNIRGTVGHFQEAFLDNGKEDMLQLIKALRDSGFEGPINPDHAVRFTGDGPGNRQYWAYAIGYMKALLHAVETFG